MEALYYKHIDNDIQCQLCPHDCRIKEGKSGTCRVRRNHKGKLITDNYSRLSAIHLDPIEKKPLYHFYPGSNILSLGSIGCNMRCSCCQNWQISQSAMDDFPSEDIHQPEQIVDLALSYEKNIGIAYTYNEPVVWYEYMLETARILKQKGKKNVVVSNGYINEKPLMELLQYADAFNIDLKAFSESFYRKITGAQLDPVLRSVKLIRNSNKHLELTCLIIPTLNDNPWEFKEMIKWICDELGNDVVLHLSRYHPSYKLDKNATTSETMEELYAIAIEKLDHVYVGNMNLKDFQDTKCKKCGRTIIRRSGYYVEIISLTDNGLCGFCRNPLLVN